ncbi:MAG: beta-propeller domain-containing protein [Planctomycetia bacterium]|nr:beta-propeller domain-containing protein [Planctomycetia bacterium]
MKTFLKANSRRPARRLSVEPLESRWMLDGDSNGTAVPPPPVELEKFSSTAELEQYLIDDALVRFDGLFGQPGWPYGWWWRSGGVFGDTPGEVAPGHSETNTQVAGVDEGDLVETDGDYLYVLSGQQLVIIDALPAEDMSVASRVHFEGQPFAQYLMGERLTVLSHAYVDGGESWWGASGGPFVGAVDIAMPFFYRTELVATVFDVSDRAAPTLLQETRLDASHVDSRAIGNLVYLVTSSGFGLPAPELNCTPPFDPTAGKPIDPNSTCVYETRDAYLTRISGQVLELGLPHYSAVDADGDVTTGLLTQPEEFYRPIVENPWNLMSVVVIDAGDDASTGPVFSTSIPTDYASQIYASTDSLYVANPVWRPDQVDGTATLLLKFDLNAEERRVDLSAVGEVPGRLLNQFSLDEHKGYLRIATTRGWGPDTENRVLVLEQTDESLDVVGRSENIGAGEQIFAVRFQGDRAFVVTFLRIDPLFALDLSDPKNPRRAGELEIPGFSNYLHPLGDSHLIGIGRNADPVTGRVQELQVSLFDVSSLDQPSITDRDSVETADWAYSEATDNHHAVGYYPEHGVLAIPISSGEWSMEDRDGDGIKESNLYQPRTELWVWRIDPSSGGEQAVALLGRIEHDSYVRRSVRIGDTLYSISDSEVKAHAILDPASQLGALYFGQEDAGIGVFHPATDDPDVALSLEHPELAAPQVVKVLVGDSNWQGEFIDLLEQGAADTSTSPVVGLAGINQIKLVFSEEVQISPSDLVVRGRDGKTYSWYGFEYNAQIATATWTFGPMATDELSITLADAVRDLGRSQLDGDSDGQAGGAFATTIGILPGDADRSGAIEVADLNTVRNGFGAIGVGLLGDVNADDRIDLNDLNLVRNNFGQSLTIAAAPFSAPTGSTLDVTGFDVGKYHIVRWNTTATGEPSSTVRAAATDVLFNQVPLSDTWMATDRVSLIGLKLPRAARR